MLLTTQIGETSHVVEKITDNDRFLTSKTKCNIVCCRKQHVVDIIYNEKVLNSKIGDLL